MNRDDNHDPHGVSKTDEKAYKICSVLGGLDVMRFLSWNVRRFFEGAIEDVELIREFIGEAASNGGIVGGFSNLDKMSHSLDWRRRGYNHTATTVQAGLGYVDDRPNRRINRSVGFANQPLVGDKQTDMAIIDSASLILPWIVDRKSREQKWWVRHHNGQSEGPKKQPFLFDSLYSAAWVGTYGEAWAYYPPYTVSGDLFTFGDLGSAGYSTHKEPYVKPNLPQNNLGRNVVFREPYIDTAQPGLSVMTAMAPIYFTGTFGNCTYNDTYIASTGVDIAISSVSSLLDVVKDRLTELSFGILVDTSFNTIVISQAVVERLYPKRTGLEDFRVTRDRFDGSVVDDRRNQTYLVSDTIFEDLTQLKNADWAGLLFKVQELHPGEREYSTIAVNLTGDLDPTDFYVMYERWQYVADWVLMVFAPIHEVEKSINVGICDTLSKKNESSIVLQGEMGKALSGDAFLWNDGKLDVAVTPKSIARWINLTSPAIREKHTLRPGDTLRITFSVDKNDIDLGRASGFVTFNVQDDGYPDCFYNRDISLEISLIISPKDCFMATGDHLRNPNIEGNCVCVVDAIEMIGGRCVSVLVLLPAMLIALSILGLTWVYVYVERKRKQADSVWEVQRSELRFNEPPQVAGRGTFGLVLVAEYRGTQVAVKRVIPPRVTSNDSHGKIYRRNSVLGMGATDSSTNFDEFLFDFDMDSAGKSLNTSSTFKMHESDDHFHCSRRQINPLSSMGDFDNCLKSSINVSVFRSDQFVGRKWFICNINSKHENMYTRLKADFVVEMRQLSKLRHPCITTVMGAVISKWEEPLLVMEYMDHGSLYDLLHNDTVIIDGDLVLPILRDIAQGLRFLHAASPQVIHGDLKAQNVLVDSKFRAKVADFGLSQKKQVGKCGTPLWMAPELLRGESGNTDASDVYSFGIVLFEVYSRKDPYDGEDYRESLRLVCDPHVNKRPTVPASMPSEVASLMSDCLGADPEARPTFEEVDNRLKRFNVSSVEPGALNTSMQARKSRKNAGELNANLLLEIFPRHVAEALSRGRKVEPEHRECVTIFFSDIVGFTTIAGSVSPSKVSDMLHRLYLKFDSLSHRHDVFKMETVGDAWMGVTNLVRDQQDHTKRIAEFAMDAILASTETLVDMEDPSKGFVMIRVGIHSGPVLANVVGSRNPKYAIFGDAVNTSARMESYSEPCRIHCSDRAAELLKIQAPKIPLSYRGRIKVKGKGEICTYWVNETFSTRAKPKHASNDSTDKVLSDRNGFHAVSA